MRTWTQSGCINAATQMMRAPLLQQEHVFVLLIMLTGRRNLADLCWALTGSEADVDVLMI